MVFVLKDAIKIELFFTCQVAHSKPSINESNCLCISEEPSLPPTQNVCQRWLLPLFAWLAGLSLIVTLSIS